MFKVGQILNSRGNGFFGRLIGFRNRFLYGKKFSWTHSAIITGVDKKSENIIVHEALSDGFVVRTYEMREVERKIEKGVNVLGETKVELKDVKKHAVKYEGRGYGFKDILHIVIYWILGTKAKFLFTGAQNLICSEAVSRILYDASGKKINFEKEFDIPYDLIEPMHLWQSKQINWLNN